MSDAVKSLSHPALQAYDKGDLADLVFADDTLLLGVSPTHLSEYLQAVTTAGQRYGLELHSGKLQLLNVRCHAQVKAPSGEIIAPEDRMTYLGTVLDESGAVIR